MVRLKKTSKKVPVMHGPILLVFNLTVETHSSIPKEDVFTKLDILEHPAIVYNYGINISKGYNHQFHNGGYKTSFFTAFP